MPTLEYATQWYPKYGIDAYHNEGYYGSGVSVYLIDTGLTNTSSRLSNVIPRNVENTMGRKDTHGSFVASILAQKATSEQNVPGIAPEAQVYLSDVTGTDGLIYTSYLVKAIQDAIALDVDIISISLGTSVYNEKLETVVREAHKKGILVIAASGNCSCRQYEFPSACDAAISIASVDEKGLPSPFNTRNDAVAVFAPGQSITVPGAKTKLSGTSFAVPFATGLLALELSKKKLHDADATMSREDSIRFLRKALHNHCDVHTYANDVCSGLHIQDSFKPKESDGLFWFLVLFICGAILGLSFAYLFDRSLRPRGVQESLRGGSVGTLYEQSIGPLSWFFEL